MTNTQLTDERLIKILSETQATIMEHNSRCVRGSVEVDARLFESMIMELQELRRAAMGSEPVAWTDEEELRDVRRVGFGEMFSVKPITPDADMNRVIPLYRYAQQTVKNNEFIPQNLDKALGVVGVALPESKEEFNFQIERWIQRLIDRVIRYADEFQALPSQVVPEGLRLALSNAGIAAPESDEMLAATHDKYVQALVSWVRDRKPFQPAPLAPEILPCAVELKPGLILEKGCKTTTLLTALRSRANHDTEIDAMTPGERAEHDASIEAFKVMLNGGRS